MMSDLPLDPNSDHGRTITTDLCLVLAEVRLAIARRKQAAERAAADSDAA